MKSRLEDGFRLLIVICFIDSYLPMAVTLFVILSSISVAYQSKEGICHANALFEIWDYRILSDLNSAEHRYR